MTFPCKPLRDPPELAVLLKQAVETFERLTPEQKRAHRDAQRKSWVIGEMMLEHPEMTREQVEGIWERVGL